MVFHPLARNEPLKKSTPCRKSDDFSRADQEVEEAVMSTLLSVGKYDVNAFAMLSLHDGGTVQVHTSKHIKSGCYSTLLSWAQSYLKNVHDNSIQNAESGSDSVEGNVPFQPLIPVAHAVPDAAELWPKDRASAIPEVNHTTGSEFTTRVSRKRSRRARRVTESNQSQRDTPIDEQSDGPQRQIEFCIEDEENVRRCMKTYLDILQQQAGKKIAKAWIKGICPKKQALFPYQDRKRFNVSGQAPRVPAWWPPQGCDFKEPDHISKHGRMDLCLHLLRLRANPEQLKAWNAGKHEPNQTHRTQGWTAFLKELVPVDEVNNIGTDKEHPQKPVKRVEIFTALYDLAQMEEEYQKGECDGTRTWRWINFETDKPNAGGKRLRKFSIASTDDDAEIADSEGEEGPRPKKSKKSSTLSRRGSAPSAGVVGGMSEVALADQMSMDEATFDSKLAMQTESHTGVPEDHAPDVEHHAVAEDDALATSTGNTRRSAKSRPAGRSKNSQRGTRQRKTHHVATEELQRPDETRFPSFGSTLSSQCEAYHPHMKSEVSAYDHLGPYPNGPHPEMTFGMHFDTLPNSPIASGVMPFDAQQNHTALQEQQQPFNGQSSGAPWCQPSVAPGLTQWHEPGPAYAHGNQPNCDIHASGFYPGLPTHHILPEGPAKAPGHSANGPAPQPSFHYHEMPLSFHTGNSEPEPFHDLEFSHHWNHESAQPGPATSIGPSPGSSAGFPLAAHGGQEAAYFFQG